MNYSAFVTLCAEHNTTPTALALKLGLSKGNTSSWKKGGNPSADILVKIADELNCTTDILLGRAEKSSSTEMSADEQELLSIYNALSEKHQNFVLERARTLYDLEQNEKNNSIIITQSRRKYIDIADIAVGAGISVPFSEDNAFTKCSFNESDIPQNADCGIPINGKSMEPEYPDGCIVWVSRTSPIKYGDIIIAIVNGEPFCKIYQPDGLHSYNKNYHPIIVSENDTFKIFGKVIGYYVEE